LTVSTTGLATGKAVGSATVTASYTPADGATAITGTLNETVLDPTPLNIAISYVTSGISSIQNKASTVLQAILSLSDSTTRTVSSLADWVVTTVSGGGNATIAVDKTANTATQTGSAAGFISTIANYLGFKSNALSLEIKPLPPAISGVAATGSAMMSANVTLTDATGKTLSVAALDDGSFKFDDLTGYTAPYQLSANVLMGEKNITHYSIVGGAPANGNNTANINQLTSAVVALVAPTGVISDLTPAQLTAITPAQVDAAVSKITTVIAPVAANIKGVSNFNPITSSFSANGVGPDALLDHNPGRRSADYDAYVPAESPRYIGPAYAILKPEFAGLRPQSLARRTQDTGLHILVSLGGVDANNVTQSVLLGLEQAVLPAQTRITVVLGLHAPWREAVAQTAMHMSYPTQLITHTEHMAELMCDADLAIGAGGSSTWERCCLGLPGITLVLAANQADMAARLETHGVTKTLDVRLPAFTQRLIQTVTGLFTDSAARRSMSAKGSLICDGLGAERTARKILAL
jgi:spore coat polysaccharide biosynthesis predicted glycosyltransferase SpsG